jgi:hypothetical protein
MFGCNNATNTPEGVVVAFYQRVMSFGEAQARSEYELVPTRVTELLSWSGAGQLQIDFGGRNPDYNQNFMSGLYSYMKRAGRCARVHRAELEGSELDANGVLTAHYLVKVGCSFISTPPDTMIDVTVDCSTSDPAQRSARKPKYQSCVITGGKTWM